MVWSVGVTLIKNELTPDVQRHISSLPLSQNLLPYKVAKKICTSILLKPDDLKQDDLYYLMTGWSQKGLSF